MDIKNNKNVLNLLYHSVISEGGDGDAIWLSKYTSLEELLKLIQEFMIENHLDWKVEKFNGYITWGFNDDNGSTQEGVIITDKEHLFMSQRSILKLNY